jgi:Tfp pilus assembly protein PilN
MDTNQNAEVLTVHKNSPLSFIFALLLLGATIAGAFYLSFLKTAIATEKNQLDTDIVGLRVQLQELKKDKVEAAQSAKKYLDEVEKNEIHWSKVIKSVKDLIPLDATTQKPKIRFLSYSGTTGGKLSLNAETISSTKPPVQYVAELLELFKGSSFFKDAYVPSVNRGLSKTGDPLLNFNFQVTYGENFSTPTSTEKAPETGSVQTPTKVPRR